MQLTRDQYEKLMAAQSRALTQWQSMERSQAHGERIDLLALEDLLSEFKKAHTVFVGHLMPDDSQSFKR
jgi:hypothetical protein